MLFQKDRANSMTSQSIASRGVRKAVEQAFAVVPYPGDDNIVTHGRFQDPERCDIEQAFKGKHWRDILSYPVSFLRAQYSALSFFSPEAYQFYLPAYLIVITESYAEAGAVPDAVLFSLTPCNRSPASLAFHRELTKKLTVAQRDAIKLFLKHLKEEHSGDDPFDDIGKALAAL